MLEIFDKWYKRYLSEEESVLLLVLLALGIVLLVTIGDILTPIVAAIVLAFLSQGLAAMLANRGLPQWAAVAVAWAAPWNCTSRATPPLGASWRQRRACTAWWTPSKPKTFTRTGVNLTPWSASTAMRSWRSLPSLSLTPSPSVMARSRAASRPAHGGR